jgi:hypothetical protein
MRSSYLPIRSATKIASLGSAKGPVKSAFLFVGSAKLLGFLSFDKPGTFVDNYGRPKAMERYISLAGCGGLLREVQIHVVILASIALPTWYLLLILDLLIGSRALLL